MQSSNLKIQNDNIKSKISGERIIILGIQTAEQPNSICLVSKDKGANIQRIIEDQRHSSEQTAKNLKVLLTKLNLSVKDIDAIAVCIGPGSYTGLRGGIAFAKAFCQFSETKLIGVSAFEALGFKAKASASYLAEEIHVLFDAGRERVFVNLSGANKVMSIHSFIEKIKSETGFPG